MGVPLGVSGGQLLLRRRLSSDPITQQVARSADAGSDAVAKICPFTHVVEVITGGLFPPWGHRAGACLGHLDYNGVYLDGRPTEAQITFSTPNGALSSQPKWTGDAIKGFLGGFKGSMAGSEYIPTEIAGLRVSDC